MKLVYTTDYQSTKYAPGTLHETAENGLFEILGKVGGEHGNITYAIRFVNTGTVRSSESSGYIRQIMTDDLFQKIFPSVRIDPSKRSLERWGTTRSGVMHAVATGSKMTGKGAGSLSTIYSGCFVVDDKH